MTYALTLWLSRFLSGGSAAASHPTPVDRKPLEIEIERLPDYLWRELGFQQTKQAEQGSWLRQ